MGCDIHFYTEKFTDEDQVSGPCVDLQKVREENINLLLNEEKKEKKEKKWISVDEWEFIKDIWSNGNGEEIDDSYWNNSEYYHGRNYAVFSILANVRNYGDSFGYDPKGIPDDASDSYSYMLDRWKGDYHSPSYFTLTELIEMNWDRFDYVEEFKGTIEKMKEIDDNYDNVRCCFFFDN